MSVVIACEAAGNKGTPKSANVIALDPTGVVIVSAAPAVTSS